VGLVNRQVRTASDARHHGTYSVSDARNGGSLQRELIARFARRLMVFVAADA
jgi:hypothetical protein